MEKKVKTYKEDLYSRKHTDTSKDDLKKISTLTQRQKKKIENDWASVAERLEKNNDIYKYQKKKVSIFTIIFYLSLSFFVLAVGIASFFLYFKQTDIPLNQLELSLTSPSSIDSGEELEYILEFENNTDYTFNNIEVFVKYPRGSLDYEYQLELEKDTWEVDDVLPGGVNKVKKRVILSGSPKDEKEIEISVNYQLEGYSSVLNQKKIFSVKIDSAPVFVKINTPPNIMSNEEFEVDIEVLSNSNTPLEKLVLIGRYPNGFEIVDNDPDAIFSTNYKNIFRIDRLDVGEKKNIKIIGRLKGEHSEEKVLSFSVGDTGNDNNEIRTEFFNAKEKIVITKPSLDLKVFCNKQEVIEDVLRVSAGKNLECSYVLKNNLATKITNASIKMLYEDDLIREDEFNEKNSYVDSNNNYILWDINTLEALSVMKGGERVEGVFNVPLLDVDDLAGYVKNPEIKLDFILSGTSFNEETSIGNITNNIVKRVQLSTDIILESGTYYDTSPFENTGGPTPQVGQKTEYTITWKIYNSTNKLEDVKVKAKLPLGVSFTDVVYPDNYYVSYDETTREVSWSIKSIEPYIGYRTDPKTMSFQVTYIPTLADVGLFKELVGEKILTAKDVFTGEIIEATADKDTTAMKGERGYSYGTGQVTQ